MLRTSITPTTRVAAVIGRPVRHSLSPLIHNAWLSAAKIDGIYLALEAVPGRLAGLIEALRGSNVSGFNVTLPFKEEALLAADRATDSARRAGAANVIVFEADGLVSADNTDGAGLLGAFAAQAPNFHATNSLVTILGAGGAARGAAAALLTAGARVRLVNRTRARAEAIADILDGGLEVFDWDEAAKALDGADALVNATSLGLPGGPPLEIALDALPATAVVMDMVYRPLKTPLLVAAEASGHGVVDGLEMLIRQAEPSFAAFFGASPPAHVDVRGLTLAALENRA